MGWLDAAMVGCVTHLSDALLDTVSAGQMLWTRKGHRTNGGFIIVPPDSVGGNSAQCSRLNIY